MHRRTVLAALGTLTAGTAGCLTQGSRSTPDDSTGTDTDDPTTSPDGATPSDPVGDVECPSFAETADRTVCWPETGDEPLYLDASSVVFEPSAGDGGVETIEFVLHNASERAVGLNPYAWGIERQTTDGWEHVAPEVYPEPWTSVESGETYTWVLSVEEHSGAMAERTMAVTEDLADGTYAFHLTCMAGDESTRETVECIALFEVRRT